MIIAEIIRKKREGLALSDDEIGAIVEGAAGGSVPDYQLSAWLMAVFFRGMTAEETFALTRSMRSSGEFYDWKALNPRLRDFSLVDKHSTGGVGDKVSLIIVPLAIALGVKVPMISGRGLGHTGGTVDKLHSVPGFRMGFAPEAAARLLEEVGACMLSQTENLCPADKKLYHLRDVTATVESFPLITASIVSKKWAEGCESLIFDVKFGEGAFMETTQKAEELGNWLLSVAGLAKLKAEAFITRMEEPLGTCIGNALEVQESVWILKNEYPSALHKHLAEPLKKLCCQIAARMALLGGTRADFEATVRECENILASGASFALFDRLLRAQGAERDWQSRLPKAEYVVEVPAPTSGIVSDIRARDLGVLGLAAGVGRRKMEDRILPAAGFELLVGVGAKIQKGEIMARLHLVEEPSSKFKEQFLACFVFGGAPDVTNGDLLWKILRQK